MGGWNSNGNNLAVSVRDGRNRVVLLHQPVTLDVSVSELIDKVLVPNPWRAKGYAGNILVWPTYAAP